MERPRAAALAAADFTAAAALAAAASGAVASGGGDFGGGGFGGGDHDFGRRRRFRRRRPQLWRRGASAVVGYGGGGDRSFGAAAAFGRRGRIRRRPRLRAAMLASAGIAALAEATCRQADLTAARRAGFQDRATAGRPGTADRSWQSAFAGSHFPTDSGLSHFSSWNASGVAHSTNYWSHNYINTHGKLCAQQFQLLQLLPSRLVHEPSGLLVCRRLGRRCSVALGDMAGARRLVPHRRRADRLRLWRHRGLSEQQRLRERPGRGTAQNYATQATTLADQGQTANPPADAEWKPLGVFALVQGEARRRRTTCSSSPSTRTASSAATTTTA